MTRWSAAPRTGSRSSQDGPQRGDEDEPENEGSDGWSGSGRTRHTSRTAGGVRPSRACPDVGYRSLSGRLPAGHSTIGADVDQQQRPSRGAAPGASRRTWRAASGGPRGRRRGGRPERRASSAGSSRQRRPCRAGPIRSPASTRSARCDRCASVSSSCARLRWSGSSAGSWCSSASSRSAILGHRDLRSHRHRGPVRRPHRRRLVRLASTDAVRHGRRPRRARPRTIFILYWASPPGAPPGDIRHPVDLASRVIIRTR